MIFKKLCKYALLAAIIPLYSCGGSAVSASFPPVHFATMPNANEYPDMPAVILLDNATIEYSISDRTQNIAAATLTHHRRLKLLTAKGAEYATIVLPVSAHSSITSVRGRLVYPDGREVLLGSSDIQRQPGRVRKEMGRVIARLPNPEVGAVVDFWYERHFDDARYVPVWNMGSELPVKRAEFAIVVPQNVELDFRHGQGQLISQEQPIRRDLEKGRSRLLWVVNDLPPLYPENDMPALQRLRNWIAPVVKAVRINGTSHEEQTIHTWEDVGNWYIENTKALHHFTAAQSWITHENNGAALYHWMQNQAYPVPADYLWEVSAGNFTDIENHQPVSVRDLAAFQVAIWRDRGQEAYPALVVRHGGRLLTEDLPSLVPFTDVVVAIKQGDGYIFSDPGCPQCGYGQLPLEMQGGAALLIKGNNNVEFINLPVSGSEDNLRFVEFNLKLKPTGELEGVFNLRAHGEAARQLRQELVKSKTEQRQALMKAITDSGTTLEISNWEIGDLKNMDVPVRVTGACKAMIKELKYQEYKFTADQITGEIYHHLWRDRRRYQLGTGGPMIMDLKLNIELPLGYEVDQPLPVEIRTGWGRYASSYEAHDRLFTFERRFEVLKPMVDSQDYPGFLDFIKKARQAEALGITFLSTEE